MVVQPPPAIRIPPPPPLGSATSLPDLPEELLISAFLGHGERDQLDGFVLAQGGSRGGGVQVEDVLNELIPDGESAKLENGTRELTRVSMSNRGRAQSSWSSIAAAEVQDPGDSTGD